MRARFVAVLVLLWLLVLPSVALAGVWREGTKTSQFTIPSTGGLLVLADAYGDPALTLPYEASTAFTDSTSIVFEPRSVRVSRNGSYLVAGGKGGYILKIPPYGPTTMYTNRHIAGLYRPFDAVPLNDGGMLVVDRGPNPLSEEATGNGRVIRLDASNNITWDFCVNSGPGAGRLRDPYTAEPLSAGHTLISDSLGHRVIEIDAAGTVVWSYGQYRQEGTGDKKLNRPHSAQRLATGNTLIDDSGNHRVLEVTPGGDIAWAYGTGVHGSGPNQLFSPNSARRLANGSTLICDTENDRVIVATKQGAIVEAYGVGGRTPDSGVLDKPVCAMRAADGWTIIGDLYNKRLARYRYRPNREYVATSGLIDPAVGKMKWFSRIEVNAVIPARANVAVEYTTDNRNWMSVPSNGALPDTTKGSAIRYRVLMSTDSAAVAPVLNDVSITWSSTAPSTGTNAEGDSGGSKTSGSSKSNGTVTHRTTTHRGSGAASASGIGSILTTTVAPGGSSAAIPGGSAGGSGGSAGEAVTQSTTMSGWVMSEVEDNVGGTLGSSGTGGFGSGSAMQVSTVPGIALLLVAYTVGLAWAPTSRLLVRVVVVAATH